MFTKEKHVRFAAVFQKASPKALLNTGFPDTQAQLLKVTFSFFLLPPCQG